MFRSRLWVANSCFYFLGNLKIVLLLCSSYGSSLFFRFKYPFYRSLKLSRLFLVHENTQAGLQKRIHAQGTISSNSLLIHRTKNKNHSYKKIVLSIHFLHELKVIHFLFLTHRCILCKFYTSTCFQIMFQYVAASGIISV